MILFHRAVAETMRRKSFLKGLLLLSVVCVAAVSYVFYTFHSKTSRLHQLAKPTTGDNTIVENSQTLFSNNTPWTLLTKLAPQTTVPTPTRPHPRRNLLIFGHDRSGTTFISAMFAKDPKIFMVYEPLWITQRWEYYEPDFYCSKCELQVVSSIVACNFTRSSVSTKFLSYVSEPWTGALPVNIFKTEKFCNKSEDSVKIEVECPEIGQHPGYVDSVCNTKFEHSVVKVSPERLPEEKLANLVPQVLLENPDIDIRVLHLVRDPRGNINSRININWVKDYPNPNLAKTARELCDTIVGNLNHADKALTELKLKHRYKLVFYKQIADDPLGTAKEIYNFAGFDMPAETEQWIVESTKPNEEKLKNALKEPYSTVRNATGNADKWRQDAFFERNRVIERECAPLMDLLGFKKIAEPADRSSSRELRPVKNQ